MCAQSPGRAIGVVRSTYSIEKVRRINGQLVPKGLKSQPAVGRETYLVVSEKCIRMVDNGQGSARHGCRETEVRCTTGLEQVEPKCCFIDRLANCEQAVVAQEDRFVDSEGEGKPISLLGVVHNTRVFVKQRMVAVKGARVLGHGFDRPPGSGPRLTVWRMSMSDCIYVWASPVDRRVDGKGRAI